MGVGGVGLGIFILLALAASMAVSDATGCPCRGTVSSAFSFSCPFSRGGGGASLLLQLLQVLLLQLLQLLQVLLRDAIERSS